MRDLHPLHPSTPPLGAPQIYNRAEKCDYGSPPFSNRDGALPPVRGSEFQLDDYIKFGVAVCRGVWKAVGKAAGHCSC